MKRNLQKFLACGLALTMLAGILTGCGQTAKDAADAGKKSTEENVTAAPEAGKETQESGQTQENGKPFEGVKLKYATTQTASTNEENLKLVELVKEQTGVELEFFVVPNTKSGEVDKTLISLMNGDEIDIIYGTKPGLKTFYNAGVLTDVTELAAADGYDMTGVYGDFYRSMTAVYTDSLPSPIFGSPFITRKSLTMQEYLILLRKAGPGRSTSRQRKH